MENEKNCYQCLDLNNFFEKWKMPNGQEINDFYLAETFHSHKEKALLAG